MKGNDLRQRWTLMLVALLEAPMRMRSRRPEREGRASPMWTWRPLGRARVTKDQARASWLAWAGLPGGAKPSRCACNSCCNVAHPKHHTMPCTANAGERASNVLTGPGRIICHSRSRRVRIAIRISPAQTPAQTRTQQVRMGWRRVRRVRRTTIHARRSGPPIGRLAEHTEVPYVASACL